MKLPLTPGRGLNPLNRLVGRLRCLPWLPVAFLVCFAAGCASQPVQRLDGQAPDPALWQRARALFPDVPHAAVPGSAGDEVQPPIAVTRVIPGRVLVRTEMGALDTPADTLPFAVVVEPDGSVRRIHALRTDVPELMLANGRAALERWQFSPGTVAGKPQPFVLVVHLRFGA